MKGGVAQQVRACGSYPQGWGFKSLRRHLKGVGYMKEKVEIKKLTSKSEVAKLLRELADQVEAGQVKVGEVTVNLSESFECELEYKVKEDKHQIEVKFEWRG
jgi:amphi-Trp domain-containing protein